MSIHPIEFRYGTPEMKAIWEETSRLRAYLAVEAALAAAEAEAGLIPEDAAERIRQAVDEVELARVKEIEAEIDHDLMAVVLALSECAGDAGRWVHFGATSYDIVDTALAIMLRDSLDLITTRLRELERTLLDLAEGTKDLVCVARTHGQIAVPTTYGMRFALWAMEVRRHIGRLGEIRGRIAVGKMSGAVGTGAPLGAHAIEIEQRVMEILGLKPAEITNQVIQRDRHAEFVFALASIATTLDKICTTVRNLQRSEIGEVSEAFGERQVGSSTMPHKRNPIKSEQVCGLARIVRGMVEPALLNNTLWEERDLTNSSSERVIFPESCILTDHIIVLTTRILKGLVLHHDRIKANLKLMQGLDMAEAVMIELTRKGMSRQRAHELIRELSMEAVERGVGLRDVLLENIIVREYLSEDEIDRVLDHRNYIGVAVDRVRRVVGGKDNNKCS
ncbi:MAG TPA: adenylosuccinate lyase [Candidatus Syntrophoarchaeum butanivorans]|uniref:Adenylosuccinate lyase n=1 Tax=Candidatus Syntropharchaeum butanivorans TaxID=1839936 RepID=A0A1F2P6N3_9EURY|nr:MAG: Adenylosuccinate lyase [Candidatus Syntrophoarchaeum butanivorans]HEC57691.1 adenylosuccinate lyase [Candidatus Syntrophoarchaeum butanivorans]